MSDHIYAQFATHNAHSVAAVLEMAGTRGHYEFQRLHGMGEALHDEVHRVQKTRCRIYAPVGEHQDLLAYLVRRLLENGANSSFVNQIVDTSITPESIARDPQQVIEKLGAEIASPNIPSPQLIYGPCRTASRGWDITDLETLQAIHRQREPLISQQWQAGEPTADGRKIFNPAADDDRVGEVFDSTTAQLEAVIQNADQAFSAWSQTPLDIRADCLLRVADLYQQQAVEFFALLAREAGKTWLDAVGEVREAVDFARYYAQQVRQIGDSGKARGVIACISPWNFPLAIFSGQIFAALAAGNCVVAKPAEQTSLIAAFAARLMHQAGIPEPVMQLLPGAGAKVGASLVADPRIAGVCFTGSTATAIRINRSMADKLAPDAALIAETGGLNAMIVDSTALPEQVVRDLLASSFQSAGQRCSALRMLYLQNDIADKILEMLFGAMDELSIGNPWALSTDVGPVIDRDARQIINEHCARMAAQGRVLKSLPVPANGLFVAPTVIELDGIEQLEQEIFGPVLHVARFEASAIDAVVDAINTRGYGLTFGVHTRVDSRIEQIVNRIQVGNIYVNRNQIGAVVGTQPFGGEGLSGTGPKAGGPAYLKRFFKPSYQPDAADLEAVLDASRLRAIIGQVPAADGSIDRANLQRIAAQQGLSASFEKLMSMTEMPGPTGESNQLSVHPRGLILCLGPSREAALHQALIALSQQNSVLIAASQGSELGQLLRAAKLAAHGIDGQPDPEALTEVDHYDAIMLWAEPATLKRYRQALARRDGVIVPLICELDAAERLILERHLCIDTTAAGGNASLIAAAD